MALSTDRVNPHRFPPNSLSTKETVNMDDKFTPVPRSPLASLTPPKIKAPPPTIPTYSSSEELSSFFIPKSEIIPPADMRSPAASPAPAAVLSYLWPFTDIVFSNRNSPNHVVDEKNDDEHVTRLDTIKQRYLALLNERNQLMTERNQLLADNEKAKERENFAEENPTVGKRVKELETRAKLDKAMIMELVAEKEYLDDRLRVSQGLVESSQELTTEKQQRIDELEKQLRMDIYKYQNELASMRAQVIDFNITHSHINKPSNFF